jgi:hypothetical protein
MISGLEAVADAIMQFEGWTSHINGQPSVSYRNRNPGNLETNGQKNVYADFITGYSDLLRELRAKFTGNNRHGITPDSTLLDLFNVYASIIDSNQPNVYCGFVAQWCTMVLDKQVTANTKLRDIWQ